MREHARRELSDDTDDSFDFRQGAGGIAEIEFMVQYLVLATFVSKTSYRN